MLFLKLQEALRALKETELPQDLSKILSETEIVKSEKSDSTKEQGRYQTDWKAEEFNGIMQESSKQNSEYDCTCKENNPKYIRIHCCLIRYNRKITSSSI